MVSDIFHEVAGVVIRSAYRGLLGREPEEGVWQAREESSLSPEQEQTIENLLRMMSTSDEFLARLPLRREFAPDTWVLATISGDLKIWLDLGDMGVSRPAMREDYESVETAFIESILKPGIHFADIGANIGWFALRAARNVGPSGKVIAFEPREKTAYYLGQSVIANGFGDRMTVHKVALGAEEGELHIGYGRDGLNAGGTWTLSSPEMVEDFQNSGHIVQSTPVRKFDDVIKDTRIDVIKIDIEGAEMLALSGSTEVIRRDKPIILTEINPGALRVVSRVEPDDLVNKITSFGYMGFYLTEDGSQQEIVGNVRIPQDKDMINVVFRPI